MHGVVILVMQNTLLITWTKIIVPMVFTKYRHEGVCFPSRFELLIFWNKEMFFV